MLQTEELQKVFHQPTRLGVMSALCGAKQGLSFVELRDSLSLTDGNLSRHLKSLEKEGMVELKKQFVDDKPRTTVRVSKKGRESFVAYLDALEEALKEANALVAQGQTAKGKLKPA